MVKSALVIWDFSSFGVNFIRTIFCFLPDRIYEHHRWQEMDEDYPHRLPYNLDKCAIATVGNTFFFIGGECLSQIGFFWLFEYPVNDHNSL